MKNLVTKLVVVIAVVIGFASCTDFNKVEEQAIELQELKLINPSDDGEIDDEDYREGGE